MEVDRDINRYGAVFEPKCAGHRSYIIDFLPRKEQRQAARAHMQAKAKRFEAERRAAEEQAREVKRQTKPTRMEGEDFDAYMARLRAHYEQGT